MPLLKKKTMIRRILTVFGGVMLLQISYGQSSLGDVNTLGQQSYNVIQTPVPFLNIAPDSRAGAMGDAGVATTPDINSMHWNAAKYAFIKDEFGFSTTYSPWLKKIAPDIRLLYLTGFYRLDKQSTVAAAIRYFALGDIIFTDAFNNFIRQVNPNEFTIDAAYSRLFSDNLSGGIAFRFIRSDLAQGSSINGEVTNAGIAFAADISMYYKKPLTVGGKGAEWTWGLNISNMGSKISYTDNATKDFIPANLRIGTGFSFELDNYNKLNLELDLNKLLVPTPPIYKVDSGKYVLDSNGKQIIAKGLDPDVSTAQGMLQSFYDAPGGVSEELKEIMLSIGTEYWYRDQFAIRAGYFNESAMKGNRKYFTLGLGLKMTLLTLDFSYLVPAAGRDNPLANTMRFTASVEFGKPKKQTK